MNLGRKISKTLRFVLAFTMALAICIGSFNIFKANAVPKADRLDNSPIVATLTIHSDPTGGHYGLPTGQHAFLSIRSKLKDRNLYVLGYSLAPNCSMTIGTSSPIDNRESGVYINAEAWLIKYKGYYKNRVSLSVDINSKQLNTIVNYIRKYNYWTELCNCSYFACNVWNSIAPPYMFLNYGTPPTPKNLAANMSKVKGHQKATQIGTCDKENVRRYYGSGQLSTPIDMREVMRKAGK